MHLRQGGQLQQDVNRLPVLKFHERVCSVVIRQFAQQRRDPSVNLLTFTLASTFTLYGNLTYTF